ncbi:IclR family transcriptional regulator C-terminal domain-containing protein [Kitasatospora sp. NBC_01539]|uniref:IclR family transcriptional regulator n=1 Tax=Kitasatospora sp. NBC_01539 TaxID=2903577 RepID=UPI0038601FEB
MTTKPSAPEPDGAPQPPEGPDPAAAPESAGPPLPAAPESAGRSRGKRPTQGDPVVERAFALLGAFTAHRRSIGLGELSRLTGIPKSSALRLARTLVGLGVLERTDGGDFVVGLRLWEIASLAPQVHGLRAVAMPYMEDLNLVTRQHVLLAVRDGDDALLVERLSAHGAGPVLYRVGGRLPLHATGVGVVLLAFADFDDRQAYLSRPWSTEPEGVPVSAAELRLTLAAVRRDGYATVGRTLPRPLVSVAAPIRDGGEQVVAALSIVVPAESEDVRGLVPAVRATARAISRGLGARRPAPPR